MKGHSSDAGAEQEVNRLDDQLSQLEIAELRRDSIEGVRKGRELIRKEKQRQEAS